jgi:hypothetical protein
MVNNNINSIETVWNQTTSKNWLPTNIGFWLQENNDILFLIDFKEA